jgi:alpha-beta hydrolase superfamily lysophospholipase
LFNLIINGVKTTDNLNRYTEEDSMIHQTWEWTTSDHAKMAAQKWMPEKRIKASIILIHGFGEHSSRYAHMAEFYCNHQIQVLTFDLRGHGKSAGARGYIPTQTTFWDDIDEFRENIKEALDDKPVFLYGHSMGGMIVLSYVLKRGSTFNGIITTSPQIDTATPISESTKKLAKFMNKIMPRFMIDGGLDRNFLSRDKSVVDAYNADPLVFGKVSTRLGVFMADNGAYIKAHAADFKEPLLMMVGSNEKIVSKTEVDAFMKSVPTGTYKVWDGLYHELHNEPEKEQVYKYTLDWIKDHMKS